jgi:hypothetical protein
VCVCVCGPCQCVCVCVCVCVRVCVCVCVYVIFIVRLSSFFVFWESQAYKRINITATPSVTNMLQWCYKCLTYLIMVVCLFYLLGIAS